MQKCRQGWKIPSFRKKPPTLAVAEKYLVICPSSQLSGYNPSYKWINPTYPIYNWGYNPLTKWDEPPSMEVS